MKNKVLLIIALLGMMVLLSGTSSPKIKIIDKGWYRVGYSEIYREPVWVEYTVLCSVSNFSRKGIGFYPEPGVKTSVDADYVNNQWDKGHMAPAADFSCDSLALHSTFSYVNCALQQENLNRGTWRYLEEHERQLTKKGKVKVKITVLFEGDPQYTPSGARIPSGFEKRIQVNDSTVTYRFPNVRPTQYDPEKYRIK